MILWMLPNKNSYQRIVAAFRSRNYFYPEVWKFSIVHKDLTTYMEYL